MISIKNMVDNNQKVRFAWFRDGEMWYRTETGFEFPVPISDVGRATLLQEDKAILFMRYIRRHMELLDKGE